MIAKPQHIKINVLHITTKSTVYNIINSTCNERSTTFNKKAMHIMGTALHIIKQIDIRQSWRSIEIN